MITLNSQGFETKITNETNRCENGCENYSRKLKSQKSIATISIATYIIKFGVVIQQSSIKNTKI